MARVLIVQGSDQARADMAATLRNEGHQVLEAQTAALAVAVARAELPEIILLDPLLPDRSGYELYASLQRDDVTLTIPVLFLPPPPATRNHAGPVALDNVSMITRLGVALRTKSLHDDLRAADTTLRSAVLTDSLTGLANRRAIEERLRLETARAEETGAGLSLVLGDIDDFAAVNDAFGYAVGDQALQAFAALLHTSCRDADSIGRYESESFLLVLPGIRLDAAWSVAERLRQRTTALGVTLAAEGIGLAASFGVSEHTAGEAWNDLLTRCVAGLRRAKRAGRNRCEVS